MLWYEENFHDQKYDCLGGKGEGGMSLMCWKCFLFPGWFFIYLLLWRSLTEEDGNLLTEIIYLLSSTLSDRSC